MFPIRPLLAATGLTVGQLGRRVRASGYDVKFAARHGLTLSQADRWALRCGQSIEGLWPAEYAGYDQLAGKVGW